MQKNWIGKSFGCEINFKIEGSLPVKNIKCFTTRPDTLFGFSFLALSIDHEVSKFYNENTNILLLTKGLAVIENQFETLADKLEKILKIKGASNPKISAVGGPCLANGLANRIKSSVVLANNNIEIVKEIGKIISTSYYSTEFTDDLIGVEVCAATKNIYSMLIGASEGLSGENLDDKIKKKYYLNTSASLVYKSLSEMKKLTKKLKGKEETVFGLAGLGDLHLSLIHI